MELLKLVLATAQQLIDAKAAGDAEAEAAALVTLDEQIAANHPEVAALRDQIAKNRAEAKAAADAKFPPAP